MTLSTTGSASNGLVYLTMTGINSSGQTITEQGSGVLLSDDEVLTAAHLVYNADGSLRTSGTAAVGYSAGISLGTSKVDGVQVDAKQDYTTVAGMGSDYAVVHLSTPITNGTIFSLGSDQATGTFDVSGYPVGTAGTLDTKTETLSVATGTNVYTGEALDDGSANPNGSSGGSIYQIVNGAPTAYGVISADLTTDTTKGFFKEFTAANVAEINSWVATADAGGVAPVADPIMTPLASSTSSTSVSNTSANVVDHSAPGFSDDIANMLNADAGNFSGQKQVLMTDVAAAITNACQEGGTFAQMTHDAKSYLQANSSLPVRAVAYLAGLLSGTTGTWNANIQRSANTEIAGSVSSGGLRGTASAGRIEGVGMGVSNTSALISNPAATLAGVIADTSASANSTQVYKATDGSPTISMAEGSVFHH